MLQADAVKSEDVPLEILRRSINLATSKAEAIELEKKLINLKRVGAAGVSTILNT